MRPPAPGELHVWRAELDAPGGLGHTALSRGERERAGRFRSLADGARWAESRAILRALLGMYLRREPGSVEFLTGPHGKPRAEDAGGLEFNLSHSGGIALLAFAQGSPVGVDVELAGRERDFVRLAERALGAEVSRRLAALAPDAREMEFLRDWVRHEAALKCRGEALGARAAPAELAIVDLDVGPGAAAAAASAVALVPQMMTWTVPPSTLQAAPAT